MKLLSTFIVFLSLFYPLSAGTRYEDPEKQKEPYSSAVLNGLNFRCIGPALTSGRISDFAVNPSDRSQYYVAVASGGVWKTTNSGGSWTPIFDNEGSYSIGCITMDPNNSSVIWVGTGENNSQRSVAYGDGIYRSDDGGNSWKNMGLKNSEHIAKIIVDPRNSDVVYAASQGPLWGPGGDRGLYKTTDGGKSWKAVLSISENTGVTDLVMDPRNPDVLYAASYQRRRHVYTVINGGPESAIFKSTDAGATWNKITAGLPGDDMGRIGLAIPPANPDIVYAVIEAANRKGGFFRSTDRGATWEKRSSYVSPSAQYYHEIYADPKNPERVYAMDTYLMVTNDGGKSFQKLGERFKHVDNHAMWIDPDNTNYYLVGSDGGVYESFDRGSTWNYKSNLPVTQFYRVSVDNSSPFYYVYGGTQDNFSLGGPSASTNISGIPNSDWFVTTGGDGFETVVDPEDPNIVYSESQYGGIVRYDRKTGEVMGIKPQEGKGEEPYRWNWDSPLIISPHSHTRLYFASNVLFKSDDRGNTWQKISGDLTRKIDRNKLPVMGKVWGMDAVAKNASTSFYGNIVALTESPLKEGLIYAGTDDGLISVTEDGGKSWRKIEKVQGVPEMTYVSFLLASQHDPNTVYAAFDNHKNADFLPYIYKSTDRGQSWKAIKSNLPARGTVYSIAEDHVNSDLLFAGTEFGLFFTADGGSGWTQLKGGLPVIAVRDLAIQKRENDLVLATFGRGFYVLDDYSPLREIKSGALNKDAFIFPVKDGKMFVQSRPIGMPGNGFMGEGYYLAENPKFGAVITYFLKDAVKTQKQLRQEKEKELVKKGQPVDYPSYESIRAEDEEEAPVLIFTITDEAGNVVKRINAPASAGVNRITWDFRYPPTVPAKLNEEPDDDPFSEPDLGMMALPGTYKVSMAKSVNGVITELAAPVSFKAVPLNAQQLPEKDRIALSEFQKKVGKLRGAVLGAGEVTGELTNRIKLIKKAILNTPSVPASLLAEAKAVESQLNLISRALNGDNSLRRRNENVPVSITERIEGIVYDQWQAWQSSTQTQLDALRIAGEEFTPVLSQLRKIAEEDIRKIEDKMENAGAPWTPGRLPVWNEK